MGSDRRVSGDAEPELSAEQLRALGRVQLTGVIVIICSTLLADLFRTWQAVIGSLGVMVVVILVLGWLAARVQHQSFRTLAREANRAVLEDFRKKRTEWNHRLGHRD